MRKPKTIPKTKPPARVGRPPGPAASRKGAYLQIRVTESMRDRCNEYAALKGRPVSALVVGYLDYLLRGGQVRGL